MYFMIFEIFDFWENFDGRVSEQRYFIARIYNSELYRENIWYEISLFRSIKKIIHSYLHTWTSMIHICRNSSGFPKPRLRVTSKEFSYLLRVNTRSSHVDTRNSWRCRSAQGPGWLFHSMIDTVQLVKSTIINIMLLSHEKNIYLIYGWHIM